VINEGERVRFSSAFFRRRNQLSSLYEELKKIEKNLEQIHPLLKEEEDYKKAKENIEILKKDLKKVIKSKGFETRIKKYYKQIEELHELYLRDLREKDKKLKKGKIPTEYLLKTLYAISNVLPNTSLTFPVDELQPHISIKEYQTLINQLKQQISSLRDCHRYDIYLIKNGNRLKIKIETGYQRETLHSLDSQYFEVVKNSLLDELEKMIKLIRVGVSK